MTKAQKSMLNQYNRATCTEVEQLYKTCSEEKKYAAKHYRAVMNHQYGGYDMRFYSATSYFFTCGFKWFDGKHERLHVNTGRTVYDFNID